MRFMGIDLHSDSFQVGKCRYDRQAERLKVTLRRYRLDDESFSRFKATLEAGDYILIESSTNAFWFHDQVINYVKACFVYNTNQARREGNKTDKIDAVKLAEKLAYFVIMKPDEKELPLVYVPEAEVREIRGLFSTYSLYQKMIVQLTNRIHSLAKENGRCLDRNTLRTNKADEYVKSIGLAECWSRQIDLLWHEVKTLRAGREQIREQILLYGSELFKREIELLLSIKGFSAFTAIALMSDICTVDRFAPILGLLP